MLQVTFINTHNPLKISIFRGLFLYFSFHLCIHSFIISKIFIHFHTSWHENFGMAKILPLMNFIVLHNWVPLQGNNLQQKNTILLGMIFVLCVQFGSNRYVVGAQGGTRTRMVSRTILSRVRLPIPPLGHILFLCILPYLQHLVKPTLIFFLFTFTFEILKFKRKLSE